MIKGYWVLWVQVYPKTLNPKNPLGVGDCVEFRVQERPAEG